MKKSGSLLLILAMLMSLVIPVSAQSYDNHDIIKEVAYAFNRQGGQIHYSQKWSMRSVHASPEDATSQRRLYLDCSSYVNAAYVEAFGKGVLPYEYTKVKNTTETYTDYAKENPDNVDVIDHPNYTYETKTELSKMLVPNLFGGCDLYTSTHLLQLDSERTRLLSEDELAVGDIIIADIFPTGVWNGNMAGDVCYIYLGNSMLLTVEDGKATTKTIGLDIYGKDADNILVALPAYNRFAVIRPSMNFPAQDSIFTDVSNDAWYFDAVKYVRDNKIIDGIYAGTFSPDMNMTRVDLVIALYRLSGSPETEIINFDDVMPYESEIVGPSETEKAISWAVKNGIATGVSETHFAPDASLTREQMATFLYRFAKFNNKDVENAAATDLSAYADKDAISAYAIDAFKYAVAQKIISGVTEDTLVPRGTLTRAQAATMLERLK